MLDDHDGCEEVERVIVSVQEYNVVELGIEGHHPSLQVLAADVVDSLEKYHTGSV